MPTGHRRDRRHGDGVIRVTRRAQLGLLYCWLRDGYSSSTLNRPAR
jgi:hypothetical protein